MGGAWESLVKLMIRLLKAITLARIFIGEELIFLWKVESLLNNCPVTPSNDDKIHFEVLTSNHLILGNFSSNHSAIVKMMELTTGKNGVQCK